MYLIDCSANNGWADFRHVKHAGIGGVWLKATEGETFTDRAYHWDATGARLAGLRVGAYHYARPDLGHHPEPEADHFCAVIERPGRRDLRPVLDLEVKTGMNAAELEGWAHRFCQRVKRQVGVLPLFYSYTAYIEEHRPRRPVGAGLWLANYNGQLHATAPHPWKRMVAHQYTDAASVPGVHGKCDKSYAPKLRPLMAHPLVGWL